MGNMSYCRFENTANDVRDCMEALEDLDVEQVAEMSEYEKQALIEFIELSNEISNQFKLDTIQELVEESESYDEYEDED
tara:strand:+ start:201 stop:437 length:237 start_codon:yes stop_codon:yes gene_type:complete